MLQQLRIATLLLLALMVITGGIYPLVVTVIAQTVFSHQANGSLIKEGDQIVGSELIGQHFSRPEYFWGRLSATSPVPYNSAASSGSNYGPLHPDLKQAAESRIAELRKYDSAGQTVPVDLVTASGSGLDPHISLAAAEFQVPRIAQLRKMTAEEVRKLIQKHTEMRQFGVLGEPRVNVLQLNHDLDRARGVQANVSPS